MRLIDEDGGVHLGRIPVLNEAESAKVRDQVHALRDFWEHRDQAGPFYTLGAASYLDAERTEDAGIYYRKARDLNPVLERHFDWLHERVAESLAEALGSPVAYPPRFGLPGFHIFLPAELFRRPVAAIHIDLQYAALDWDPASEPDFAHPLSFTLSIALPRGGAGLRTWDLDHAELRQREGGSLQELVADRPPHFHEYRVGHLAMHSGHMVHQIAPSPDLDPDDPRDERLTLQGHGIRCGGVWQLYW